MADNMKELTKEELAKVNGGVSFGDERIVRCDNCGAQFNPDTATKGKSIIRQIDERGASVNATFICPHCGVESTFTVIQLKHDDLNNIDAMKDLLL